ncbi:uncharacterized protein LOC135815635 [Sycon ciliatum]|uniref:uncharacterized protein LOC135815635 n=1 Tax=Sycon ciliatum TaxID=27933 RepID=UPI0031F61987
MKPLGSGERVYIPGRLWVTLWTFTQLIAGVLCFAIGTLWLHDERFGTAGLPVALQHYEGLVFLWKVACTELLPKLFSISTKIIHHALPVCSAGLLSQFFIVRLQRRLRPVDVLVVVCWFIVLACHSAVHSSWKIPMKAGLTSMQSYFQLGSFCTSAFIFWVSLVARCWRHHVISQHGQAGGKPQASHLRKRAAASHGKCPADSDSDDSDHAHADAADPTNQEAKVSHLDTHLFNMSLGPSGNGHFSPAPSPQGSSWLGSAMDKGLFHTSSTANGNADCHGSPTAARRRQQEQDPASSPKPLVSPARFTMPAVTSSPHGAHSSFTFSASPTFSPGVSPPVSAHGNRSQPASLDFHGGPRRRPRRNTLSDDEDFQVVSYAEQTLVRQDRDSSVERPQRPKPIATAKVSQAPAENGSMNNHSSKGGQEKKSRLWGMFVFTCLAVSMILNIAFLSYLFL